MANYLTRIADWNNPDDNQQLRALRNQVFVEEQGVDSELEWDQADAAAIHIVAEVDGQAVGCARLISTHIGLKIGRVAVAAAARGQGAGRAIMESIQNYAEQEGFQRLYLEAQTQAYNFYFNLGYEAKTTPITDCGIPHITMDLCLDENAESPAKFIAGEDNKRYNISSPIEWQGYFELQLQQCTRQLRVQWQNWNHPILKLKYWQTGLVRLVKQNAQSKVKFLMSELDHCDRDHPLLALQERMGPQVELRLTSELLEPYFIFDLNGYLRLERTHGWTCFSDRPRIKGLTEHFDQRWQLARIPEELKALHL